MKSLQRFSLFLLLIIGPLQGDAFLLPAGSVLTTQSHSLRRSENAPLLHMSDDPTDEDKAAKPKSPASGNASVPGDAWSAPSGPISSDNTTPDSTSNAISSTPAPDSTKKEEEESDSAPKNERKLSDIFVVDDPGALVAKFNPWEVISDLAGDKFGERGEAWLALSLLLLVSILGGGLPLPYINTALTALGGPGLMLAGGALILASVSDLGSKNLTPFLSPTSKGSLITDGLYSKIRHPIYAGLIALCGGLSIATESSTRLVLTGVLVLLLNVKSDKEEEKLMAKFPQYDSYRKTTGKFFPGDWSF